MPITLAQLDREVRAMLRKGDIDPRWASVSISAAEDADHARNRRRYASVDPVAMDFRFARAALSLDAVHREGLVAHEVGHVLADIHWSDRSEPGADRAACQFLDVQIGYDRRWPGKGLQYAKGPCQASSTMARRNPTEAQCDLNLIDARDMLISLAEGDTVRVTTKKYGTRTLLVTGGPQYYSPEGGGEKWVTIFTTSGRVRHRGRGLHGIKGGAIQFRGGRPPYSLYYQPTMSQNVDHVIALERIELVGNPLSDKQWAVLEEARAQGAERGLDYVVNTIDEYTVGDDADDYQSQYTAGEWMAGAADQAWEMSDVNFDNETDAAHAVEIMSVAAKKLGAKPRYGNAGRRGKGR